MPLDKLMIWICIILTCISCLWISFEDFKTRRIHLYPFLIMIFSGLVFQFARRNWDFVETVGTNVMILAFIFFSIILVYRIKGETQIMDTKMGWGDWIFFLGLAVWLDPEMFLLFYALSTVGITTGISLLQLSRYKLAPGYPIPLAGILGLIFTFFLPIWQLRGFFNEIIK